MMFLEFAIWGAWSPVLWRYLVTPVGKGGLGFSDPQAGWIYNALVLACMVAPFIGGQIVDRWFPTQWFLVVVSFAGGLLMLYMARQESFGTMMTVMVLYSLFYAPTLALTASLCFHHLADPDKQFGSIRVFGSIGWIAAGWALSGWRWLLEKPAPADMLYVAGVCSLAMGVLCCFLPHTPPKKEAEKPWAFVEALRLFKNPHFALFMAISFVAMTQLQFYYLPTSEFLEKGVQIAEKNVPAVMTAAQIAEIVVMGVFLGIALKKLGIRKTLAIGVIAWPLRFVVFAFYQSVPYWLVVASMTLHGIGYPFFFIASQIYVNKVAPPDIRGSAQALLTFLTLGLGSFLGIIFTTWVLKLLTEEGVRNWQWIFLIPCFLTVACAFAFLLFFRDPRAEAAPAAEAPAEEAPAEELPAEEPPAEES